MTTVNDMIPTIDVFVDKFRHLSPEEQAALLDKLAEAQDEDAAVMVHLPEPTAPLSLEELAGSWEDDRSAEEIVEDLRRSRRTNRDRVNL